MKIQKTPKDQYVVTVPKALALAKGFQKGDEVTWELNKKGNLVLRKV